MTIRRRLQAPSRDLVSPAALRHAAKNMNLLVVGSTAFDTIETPHAAAKRCLGGSSTYFALAARMFTPVRLVSVVGQDFPSEHRQLLESRGIDLAGLETKPGKTFAWHGRYSADMNSRTTIDVQLNTFGDFQPKVPSAFRDSRFVFLANGAKRRGRDKERLHPMLSNHAPVSTGIRRSHRLAFIKHAGTPADERPVNDVAVTHDPAHV